jgi:hypothetical protein
VDAHPGIAVESVTDSSRYFVLRIKDDGGRCRLHSILFSRWGPGAAATLFSVSYVRSFLEFLSQWKCCHYANYFAASNLHEFLLRFFLDKFGTNIPKFCHTTTLY